MLKNIIYSLFIMTLAVGCATKKKDGEGADGLAAADGTTMSEADISEKSLAFDPMGSDSGSIAGLVSVRFDYDSTTLRSDAKEALAKNADWLKTNPGTNIQIEGHCDSRGSNEYNLSLGERRASAVKTYMQGLGVEGNRMSTISYGEEKLIAMGDTENDHARNRRANFVPAK